MRKKIPRRPKDPARDAEITRQFHRMLDTLREPPRPPDGVLPVLIGYVQLDVRFMQSRRRAKETTPAS